MEAEGGEDASNDFFEWERLKDVEGVRRHLKKVNGQWKVNWRDPEAGRSISRAILLVYYDLDVHIPQDRLCPTVSNRLNYLRWLKEIVGEEARGVDIGTGATAIYPLLACRLYPHWRVTGTEIDNQSLECAKANVTRNDLNDRIALMLVDSADPLIPSRLLHNCASDPIDFVMTNPPFYESWDQVEQFAKARGDLVKMGRLLPGTANEMITEGGEIGFITRLIQQSLKLRERVRWYTSLVGIMNNIPVLVKTLKTNFITNYALAEFRQGYTWRWAIAWSFTGQRLPESLSRFPCSRLALEWPPHTHYEALLTAKDPELVKKALETVVENCKFHKCETVEDHRPGLHLDVTLQAQSWTRQSRRHGAVPVTEHRCLLNCEHHPETLILTMDWIYGEDVYVVESLFQYILRVIRQL